MAEGYTDGVVRFATRDGGSESLRLAVPDAADDGLAAALRAGRFETTPATRLVLALAPGRRLFDVGAHLGTVALPAARLGARVVAVEPSPRNVAALARSIEANGLDVTLVHAAVSDARATLHLDEQGPYSRVEDLSGGGRVAVEAITLADVVERAGMRPDVLKLDVEGHELEALAGLEAMVDGAVLPDLVVESNGHLLRRGGRSPRDLVERLSGLGYVVHRIEAGTLVPVRPGDVQPETVADLLGTASTALPWPEARPPAAREVARRLTAELRHEVLWHRAFAAAELRRASSEVLADRGLRAALADARSDPAPEVREAVSWWTPPPARRRRLLRRRG